MYKKKSDAEKTPKSPAITSKVKPALKRAPARKKSVKGAQKIESGAVDSENTTLILPKDPDKRQKALIKELEKLQNTVDTAPLEHSERPKSDAYARNDEENTPQDDLNGNAKEISVAIIGTKNGKTAISDNITIDERTEIPDSPLFHDISPSSEIEPLTELQGEANENEPYRTGVFLLDAFPQVTSEWKITPQTLYSALIEFANTPISIIDTLKANTSINYYQFTLIEKMYPEVSILKEYCEGVRVGTLQNEAMKSFSQNFSELPNIAFKGDEVVGLDPLTREPIGELSQSYIKYSKDRHDAYMNYAKMTERGYANEKQAEININNNQTTSIIGDIKVEDLAELNPIEWGKK